ncbi:hypothetical protein M9H77_30581 [Catharanthus roseus]|uniref:Uncharacterized protein n=1 Tax=Catharanthus roseus TaxID=4058 RepID=A0ACB9ZXZ8_CATRO|nr:hypothetical protein M9H77_30581 [Catharanthus roseus]
MKRNENGRKRSENTENEADGIVEADLPSEVGQPTTNNKFDDLINLYNKRVTTSDDRFSILFFCGSGGGVVTSCCSGGVRRSHLSYLCVVYIMPTPKCETDKFEGKTDFVMWRRKMKDVLVQNKIAPAFLVSINIQNPEREKLSLKNLLMFIAVSPCI